MNKIDPTKLKKPSAADLLIIERLSEVIDAVSKIKEYVDPKQNALEAGKRACQDTCPECWGKGEITSYPDPYHYPPVKTCCPTCNGTGKKPELTDAEATELFGKANGVIAVNCCCWVCEQTKRCQIYRSSSCLTDMPCNGKDFQLKKELAE